MTFCVGQQLQMSNFIFTEVEFYHTVSRCPACPASYPYDISANYVILALADCSVATTAKYEGIALTCETTQLLIPN